jgi:hypothetical protein
MSEEQHLREVAQLCRRESGNSVTSEARVRLSEMAAVFDERAADLERKRRDEELVFVAPARRGLL